MDAFLWRKKYDNGLEVRYLDAKAALEDESILASLVDINSRYFEGDTRKSVLGRTEYADQLCITVAPGPHGHPGTIIGYMFFATPRRFVAEDGSSFYGSCLTLGAAYETPTVNPTQMFMWVTSAIEYLQQWEEQHHRKIVLHYVTGNPTVFMRMQRLLKHHEPDLSGNYSPQGALIANSIKEDYYHIPKQVSTAANTSFHTTITNSTTPADHPFALRNFSYFLFKEKTLSIFEENKADNSFTLFEDMGLISQKGDRGLCFGYLPAKANIPSNFSSKSRDKTTATSKL